MTETKKFVSICATKREQRNRAIYAERNELLAVEGQYVTGVNKFLCEKYGITQATLYNIINKFK